jgi:hypothetical protein
LIPVSGAGAGGLADGLDIAGAGLGEPPGAPFAGVGGDEGQVAGQVR